MYFIEKIARLYFKYKNKNKTPIYINNEQSEELEDVLTCKHHFMPVDSTNEIFACTKCGYLINRNRIKKISQE